MPRLALVILAAGLGRRYGGLKQLEPVGPGGEALLEYTIYDAWRAGVTRVVIVVRPETRSVFERALADRLPGCVEVAFVEQRIDDRPPGFAVPPGRTRPWGTAHALLAAAHVISEPFIVANADDFYGAAPLTALATFLREKPPSGIATYAMVGFRLGDTLPDRGAVSRAVCRCGEDGWLQEIEEIPEIERAAGGGRCTDANGRERFLPFDTLVSMNLWGLRPDVFDTLRADFRRFLRECGRTEADEWYLPAAVQSTVHSHRARVRVLAAGGAWCGITHVRDAELVAARIRRLVAEGAYPENLRT